MQQAFRPLLLLSLLSGLFVLSLPFLPPPESSSLGLGTFFGRLHPLVVHFPVVLVMLLLMLEAGIKWKQWQQLRLAVDMLLPLAILSSLLAVIMGYLLYRSGDYSGDLVEQHLWGGVWLTTVLLATGINYLQYRRTSSPSWLMGYASLLVIGNLLLVYTAHVGGSLTHGPDYLTEALPDFSFGPSPQPKDPNELRVYEDVVMGVFEAKCLSCHNEHKAKGGLVMANFDALMEGGNSGKAMLVGGAPDSSELFHRVILPSDDDDHMPPSGKPDLKEVEIEILKAWIAAGADPDQRLAESDPALQGLVQQYMPELLDFQRKQLKTRRERDARLAELRKVVAPLNLRVEPDPDADSMLFALSMVFPPAYVADETLVKLLPYAEYFSKISLPAAEITDDGLYHLSQFSNLRRLYLQKTCIKGEGLVYLKNLPKLEDLSLAHTSVDEVAALKLIEFPALKRVYFYNSYVGANLVQALDKYLPDTRVLPEEGPYF